MTTTPPHDEPTADELPGDTGSESGRPSQATELIRLARAAYTLHVSPDGDPFALPDGGPPVARLLRGQRGSLRADLAAAYYDRTRRAASASGLADALNVIDGLAARTTPPVPLFLRCAEHDGAIWLDLGRTDGRSIRITGDGWHTHVSPDGGPVWRRTALTGELPEPVRGGRLDDLWDLLNVGAVHRPLVVAWLVAALLPSVPVPILGVTGEQGTGKSSATRALVSLLDPSPAPLRTGPRELADWIVAASGSRVVGLDNVSGMPPWLSDALCRAVTGEGLVRRALFTDDDLSVVFFRRVIVMNGIDLGIGRGDLADRLIVAELERITEDHRRLDAEVAERWARIHPTVLGALLDLAAGVLAALPSIRLDTYPRMADYARVLATVDTLTGTDGLAAYLGQRDQVAADLINGDPLAAAIRAHVEAIPFGDWTGTAADLLDTLHRPLGAKSWPSSPKAMGTALTRLAPALRSVGIAVEQGRREPGGQRRRLITLRPAPPEGTGPDRPDRPDGSDSLLTSTNARDGLQLAAWPPVASVPNSPAPASPPSQAEVGADLHGNGRRDGGDGALPRPPVGGLSPICIVCRERLSYDDGTHTHPMCDPAALAATGSEPGR